jgi:hypothetical protein
MSLGPLVCGANQYWFEVPNWWTQFVVRHNKMCWRLEKSHQPEPFEYENTWYFSLEVTKIDEDSWPTQWYMLVLRNDSEIVIDRGEGPNAPKRLTKRVWQVVPNCTIWARGNIYFSLEVTKLLTQFIKKNNGECWNFSKHKQSAISSWKSNKNEDLYDFKNRTKFHHLSVKTHELLTGVSQSINFRCI